MYQVDIDAALVPGQEHQLSLNSPWFELVRDGKKTYEGRRNTPKIRQIQVNDIIKFRHHTDVSIEPFKVRVLSITKYSSFEKALMSLPIDQVLPIPGITLQQGIDIYQKYVSLKTQQRDGIVMIQLTL